MKPLRAPKALTTSDCLYRMLLAAYPVAFRRDYGTHMAQIFRDSCRTAYGQDGIFGVLALWPSTVLDLIVTALEEHMPV